MGTATCAARQRIEPVGLATVLVTALLLGPFICTPVGAQAVQRDQTARPATNATKAAKDCQRLDLVFEYDKYAEI